MNIAILLSPVTTAANAVKELSQATYAAAHGDWGAAAQHGVVGSADTAYTVLTVVGAAGLARGLAQGLRNAGTRGAVVAADENAATTVIRTACKNSFDPKTAVLLAGGTTRPIGEIRVGDRVTASAAAGSECAGQREEERVRELASTLRAGLLPAGLVRIGQHAGAGPPTGAVSPVYPCQEAGRGQRAPPAGASSTAFHAP